MKRFRLLIPLVLIPAAVLVGSRLLGGRRHLIVSLAVAILALWLFALGYERRQAGSRRMVLASVMIALSSASTFFSGLQTIFKTGCGYFTTSIFCLNLSR